LHCRTACRYGGKNIAFHVNEGSTSFWLSLLVEFEDGDGDIGSMQLKQVRNNHITRTFLFLHILHAAYNTSRVHLSGGVFFFLLGNPWGELSISFPRDRQVFVGSASAACEWEPPPLLFTCG